MKKKNLPIGIQTFKNIREGNYVYIDKTEQLYPLVENAFGSYFLSRPRRFGKSLLVSTMKELFEGNRALFEGLWIEDKWDWSQKSPVIHISFDAAGYRSMGLERAILSELKQIADKNGITLSAEGFQQQFKELIQKLAEKDGKVVILIDEYDKPIIDFLEKDEMVQAKTNQVILKSFYSALKSSESSIRMLFITGVSKFAKVSIFSDLNHLEDLTIDGNYGTLVGYTQAELEFSFANHIQLVMDKLKISREYLLENMREWYNGYSWDGETTVYNPFGILNFFSKKTFRNFWFATGSPTFLIKLMRERADFEFEDKQVSDIFLERYDLDNIELVPLLFQTGYLTIKELNFMTGDMVLGYPNKEVKDSMYQFLIDDIASASYKRESSGITVQYLNKAFKINDLEKVKDIINTLFSDLPHNLHEMDKRKSERFFHGLIHLLFKYLGVFVESEVRTAKGRADSVVQTDTHVYIFEFKADKTAEEALEQLLKNGYANKYKLSGKTILGIAVNFNSIEREIDGWIEKEL